MFFCGATYHEKEIREYVLLRLRTQWNQLHTRFGTTYPLKIHIMLSHANDYVELVGGGLSKRGNDQVTEAAHQYLKSRMEKSGYWVRKVGTEAEGEGLYRAVVHTNSYNL